MRDDDEKVERILTIERMAFGTRNLERTNDEGALILTLT